MKCLSLWQPWATLLVSGRKRVETRSWPIRHRGPLLIHAAKKWTQELSTMALDEPFRSALEGCKVEFGSIIGRVTVRECYPTERVNLMDADCGLGVSGNVLSIGTTEAAFGDYSPGRFAFLCVESVAFDTPIPFRGMQGLFDVPDQAIPAKVPA